MATKIKTASLAERIEAERKKIAALEQKITKLQEQEVQRIGKLAEASGCLDVAITDAEYKLAFEQLVKSKVATPSAAGNAQASNDANNSLLVPA